MPLLVLTWRWLNRPFELLDELAARYGEAFMFRLPGLPRLAMFADPEAVKEIFADDGDTMQAGRFNAPLRAFVGDKSLLVLDGREHKRQRKLMLPPFHGERMQAYGQVMLDLSNESIDKWPLGESFSVHPFLQTVTLRVIIRTVFGIDEGARLDRMTHDITRLLELGSWGPLLVPWVRVDLGPRSPWGAFRRAGESVNRELLGEIRQRRAHGAGGRTDVLSLLLEARDDQGEPMTEMELRDELVTLLVAGHETTATSLSWALRWILASPDVERRLREELETASSGGEPSPEKIAKLPYLDAVARETLRLQPVVPLVGRVLATPTRVGGYDLPAGMGVACSMYLAQRRPSVYPDPTRFDPERFLGTKISPNEFFPFGGGVRRCIGMAFALYEMKMVLASVVVRTRMHLEPGSRVRPVRRSITLSPSDGLRVVLDERRARPVTSARRAEARFAPASPSRDP
jgi:cytochrome P450